MLLTKCFRYQSVFLFDQYCPNASLNQFFPASDSMRANHNSAPSFANTSALSFPTETS